jgi:hypothetical protein
MKQPKNNPFSASSGHIRNLSKFSFRETLLNKTHSKKTLIAKKY